MSELQIKNQFKSEMNLNGKTIINKLIQFGEFSSDDKVLFTTNDNITQISYYDKNTFELLAISMIIIIQ